jgi:hypothetical protein
VAVIRHFQQQMPYDVNASAGSAGQQGCDFGHSNSLPRRDSAVGRGVNFVLVRCPTDEIIRQRDAPNGETVCHAQNATIFKTSLT